MSEKYTVKCSSFTFSIFNAIQKNFLKFYCITHPKNLIQVFIRNYTPMKNYKYLYSKTQTFKTTFNYIEVFISFYLYKLIELEINLNCINYKKIFSNN